MYDAVKAYLNKYIPQLTTDELSLITSKGIYKKLRKKQLLLSEGEVCRIKIFVITGLLRNYKTDDAGNDFTMKFTAENNWTTDADSYNNGLPAGYNIEAIEPTEVMFWHRDIFEEMRLKIPALALFSERIITHNMSLIQNRILLNISASAEKKYLDFIENNPHIFQRIPLYMVASYLGVSRETLTRIRQGLTAHMKA